MPQVGQRRINSAGNQEVFGENRRWNRVEEFNKGDLPVSGTSGDVIGELSGDGRSVAITAEEKDSMLDSVIDDFESREMPWADRKDYREAIAESEPFLEAQREKMNALIESGDAEGLFTLAHDVAFSQEKANIQWSYMPKKGEENYKEAWAKRNEAEGEFSAIFAQAIHNATDITGMHSDVVEMPEGTAISDSVPVGRFEPNTREWLEARQSGMGASDYATLNDKESPWRDKNLERVRKSKTQKYTDEDIDKDSLKKNDDDYYRNRMHRGSVLEDYVAHVTSQPLLDKGYTIMHNKDTHKFPGSYAQINYDYLIDRSGNGKPDGIFEIKTAKTDRFGWGKESDGIDGLPTSYRVQALVQAHCMKAEHGALGVLFNESEPRTYQWEMTPELHAEAQKYIDDGDATFEKWTGKKS